MGKVAAPGTDFISARSGGLRRLMRGLTASRGQMEAAELRAECEAPGVVPIAESPQRQRVRLAGTLRVVSRRPLGGVPALEAELYDGSDAIRLVWLGRRGIPGIEPGRMVRVQGTIGVQRGRKLMFNPLYELRPVTPS
jgi:hypothetical protein